MAKYADWYAVELDGFLKGRISDVRRFEAVKEITSHLSEHVDDLISKGMDPFDAEKAAIRSFGSPRKAAVNLLRESKRPGLGKLFSFVGSVGMLALLLLLGITYQEFFLKQGMGSFGYLYFPILMGSFLTTVVGLILGTVLTRKVPVGLMLVGWAIGIALVIGNFIVKRDLPYAQIPREKFVATLAGWKAEQVKTAQLGHVLEAIYKPCSPIYVQGRREELTDQTAIIKVIRNETPKLVATHSPYIHVTGKLTSGYLSPAGETPYEFGSTFPRSDANGIWFPARTEYQLKYFATMDEAVKSWIQAAQYDGYRSMMTRLGDEQQEFIDEAIYVSNLTTAQRFMRTVGPFTGISFAILVGMMIIGLLIVKVPNLTIQSSFRRRLA